MYIHVRFNCGIDTCGGTTELKILAQTVEVSHSYAYFQIDQSVDVMSNTLQ